MTGSTGFIEFRGRQGVTQDWTLSHVPGPRMPDIPVYVLTSRHTFSCAEDLSFCLQTQGRAAIIGETTAGGAHDAKLWAFPEESITLQIPFNEAVDPRTKKTREGVGIKPDIPVLASQAVLTALREAVKTLSKKTLNEESQQLLAWIDQDCAAQLQPPAVDPQVLPDYPGSYGPYQVTLECNRLYLQYNEGRKRELAPLGDDRFRILADERFGLARSRVQFKRDGSNRVTNLHALGRDGRRSPDQPKSTQPVSP